jgi:cell division protein FtsB
MKINIGQYKAKAQQQIDRFRDVRFSGQIVFIALTLLISWSGVKSIQTNYGLQKQVTALAQQNTIQKLENENLKLQNSYYNSNQYLELSSRQNFGLAAAGEKEILVPQKIALAYSINVPTTVAKHVNDQQPITQHNFESWVDFFLHRQ